MQIIDIYDVASKVWYQQITEGGPTTKTRGCAVVAPARDFSSFNIYYYGGYDGIHLSNDFSDEVWVLSLPSFTWTSISKGTASHARAGHKCFMPYPDQMMVFGGATPRKGTSLSCLDQGPIVVFNLTSGAWMDSYSPTNFADYGVHRDIVRAVGGNAAGGATVTKPASGWSSRALGDIFSVAYDQNKLKRYYPYPSAGSTPRATNLPDNPSDSGGQLKILLPAILGSIAFLSGTALAIWCFCCKHRRRSSRSTSSSTAADSSRNVAMWLRGHRASKQLTFTDSRITSTAVSPDLTERAGSRLSPLSEKSGTVIAEMADTQVSELCGET